ncbi:restriction endonuclease subunit S [Prevotella sp. MGM1]|uniref:restriction endonuclease subunit S n=1 Tax=Prevotella sp. MGM1 TaxID=2033405 RepID=UPI000CEA393A|nr:restriction endonuclease subunit S [Prevotella sp. MGM1]GAY27355.1 restriction endonuclease subunit S [Prevotella sp. MGM1]
MEQWKEYKISEIIEEIAMGPFGSNIKVDNFIDSGIPVLNGSNLQGIKLNEDSFNYVSEEKADTLGRANAFRGDVVITHRGTLGQIVYIPLDSKYERYVISQSQFRLKLNKDIIRPDFFVYFFHTRLGQHRLLVNASQVGVPALARPTSTFKEVFIPVPPMEMQNKVMGVLHSIDSKIELNRRINDNLEQQAQALFKAWFVEFEPFGGTMPSNWEICEAQKYFNINIGKTPPRNEMRWFSQKSTDCKWASISDLGKCGLFINDTSEYLTKDAVETFNIIVVPKGTILLSFKLTLGRVSITTCPLTTNEAIARFLINHDYEREYLYLLLKQFDYTSLGNTSSIATAVNSKIIRSMPIMMPTVDVLQRFHHIVSPIFTRMRFLSDEIMQLTDTRNTVLPQLMSGGLKINNLNC